MVFKDYRNFNKENMRDLEKIEKDLDKIGSELYNKFGTDSYNIRCKLHDIKSKLKSLSETIAKSNKPSRDYKLLFDKISMGEEVPCFVDYFFRDTANRKRDIAAVKRLSEKHIGIGARGIQYGGVADYDLYDRTVFDAFIDECERLNLEYYT